MGYPPFIQNLQNLKNILMEIDSEIFEKYQQTEKEIFAIEILKQF